MSRHQIEERFFELSEGLLSEDESLRLQREIEADPVLLESYRLYQKVIEAESDLAHQNFELNANFEVKVMEALDTRVPQGGFVQRFVEMYQFNRRQVIGGATACVLVSVALYAGNETGIIKLNRATTASRPLPGVNQVSEAPREVAGAAPANSPQITYNDARIASEQDGAEDKWTGQIERFNQKLNQSNTIVGAEPAPSGPSVSISNLTQGGQAKKERMQEYEASTAKTFKPILERLAPLEDQEEVASGRQLIPPGRFRGDSDDATAKRAEPNSEAYAAYVENDALRPSVEPVSTFSIDVDTGSYTNTRRFLSQGQLPPADSVRIEEYLNYFDYDYPSQSEKPFALTYEVAPSPLEPEKQLLRLALATKQSARSDKPWNLVFLVDVSGSMDSPDKLELVKRSLPVLVDGMRPTDTVSIVTYAGSAGVLLDGSNGGEKDRIKSVISSLGAGGSTNGSGGIDAAYRVAQSHFIPNSVNRVVLVTDGDFNVGVTSLDALKTMIEEKRKSGITLTTIGVGTGNVKDVTMEQLADIGNGAYLYFDSFKEARKVFETDLVSNMEVVAKDVKIQVEFNPSVVTQYRLIGYENRKLRREDFDNDKIDAGEIGAGHRVTALYEIVLAGSEAAKKIDQPLRYKSDTPAPSPTTALGHEIGFLKVRFKQPHGDTSELSSFPLETSSVKREVSQATTDFKFAAAVTYFGSLLRHSKFVGSYTFGDIATLADANIGEDKNGYRREFVELVKNAKSASGSQK